MITVISDRRGKMQSVVLLSDDAENYVYGLVIPPESGLEWTYLLEGGIGQGSTLKKRP